MKQLFTTVAVGLCLLAGTSAASAQTTLASGGTIEQGVQYTLQPSTYGVFTAPSEGKMTVSYTGFTYNNVYEESAGTTNVNGEQVGWANDYDYDWTYQLSASQTVYVVNDDFLNPLTFKVTFEGGSAPVVEPYEIVSMTPAQGNLELPSDEEASSYNFNFTVTLNKEFSYSGGRPPYWQLYDVEEGSIVLSSRDFNDNGNTASGNVMTCQPVPYDTYKNSVFVVGKKLQFQMSLDNGANTLNGYTWTVVANGDTGEPEPEPGVQAEAITPGTPFNVEEDHLLWSYTPDATVDNFYLKVVFAMEANLFEQAPMGGYLALSENPNGSNPIQLNYIQGNGESYYTGTGLQASTTYYVVGLGDYATFSDSYPVTLYLTEYNAGGNVPTVPTITLDVPFTVSSSETTYSYSNVNEGAYYLITDTDEDILNAVNGTLKVMCNGINYVQYWDIENVNGTDGLVYNGLNLQANETYEFVYSGTEPVELTLVYGTYTPQGGTTYMEDYADILVDTINVDDLNSAVELSWGETVTIVDADAISIPVYLTGGVEDKLVGRISGMYVQLQGEGAGTPGEPEDPSVPVPDAGVAPAAETGDSGNVLFILTGASELFQEEGTYLLKIPEGIVANEDGDLNLAQEVVVTVTSLAVGVVTPESGTVFEEGEAVSFTVTFKGEIVPNDDAEVVLSVYSDRSEGDAYYKEYDWGMAGIVAVSADANSVEINLGSQLEPGFYYVTMPEGVLTVADVDNALVEVMFEVKEAETDGINSIESALNGSEAIYNLQGVKVNKANLGKGLYIINGKKVLVK